VLAVSADGERLVLATPLRLHDLATGTERELRVDRRVMAAGFSEDGSRLAVATWGSLHVFGGMTGQLVTRFGEHADEEGDLYAGVTLSADGARLVTSSLGGGRAHVWDVGTGEAIRPVPRDLLGVSPDGADVVAHGFRGVAADLSAGLELGLGAHAGALTIVVAPDRTAMLAVQADPYGTAGGSRRHEYALPACQPLLVDPQECIAATFSPDATRILAARPDGTIDESPSRAAADVLARARRFVFRELSPEDLAAFDL
jgi:WD40 repeat protein